MSPRRKAPRVDGDDDKNSEIPKSPRRRSISETRGVKGRLTSSTQKKEYKVIKVHTLGKNETWTHLAAKYYGNTTEPYWRHIYEFNKEMVGDNYKRIWGGMEIKIPELPEELKKKDK